MPAPPFQINAFFKDCGYMILSAPQDRLYWFLFTEMDKATGKMIPKFTKEDERRLAEDHFGNYVTDSATFQDIYEHRQQTALVALEENVFSRWYYKRIVIIGDAAHKVLLPAEHHHTQ
jgi:2-polyprenyl-6-methoxyphenol hydroxylase-like FAD-dependent oxidoreductase